MIRAAPYRSICAGKARSMAASPLPRRPSSARRCWLSSRPASMNCATPSNEGILEAIQAITGCNGSAPSEGQSQPDRATQRRRRARGGIRPLPDRHRRVSPAARRRSPGLKDNLHWTSPALGQARRFRRTAAIAPIKVVALELAAGALARLRERSGKRRSPPAVTPVLPLKHPAIGEASHTPGGH